jgi:hypothetical protein
LYCKSCGYLYKPPGLEEVQGIGVMRIATNDPSVEPILIQLIDPDLIGRTQAIASPFVTETRQDQQHADSDNGRASPESEIESQVNQSVSEPPLSEDQKLFLAAALRLSAFDSDHRKTARAIVKRAKGDYADPPNAKKALADLVRPKRLLASVTGATGGYWLTSEGRRRAMQLASPREGDAGAEKSTA